MSENEAHTEACSACATHTIEEKAPIWKQHDIAKATISFILLSIGLVLEFQFSQQTPAHILYLGVIAVAGYSIFRNAVLALIQKRVEMNLLMSVAAAGAFLTGHAEEGASVIFLFFIAEFLEDYAAQRARRSVSSLLKLSPEMALVKGEGQEIQMHVHDVSVGEIVLVKPGERIPLDGIVSAGNSSVNESPLTGESVPAQKEIGSQVYAGTINVDGFLEAKVTKKADESMIAQVVRLVREAQEKKSPTERFVDRFASRYTPTVIALAVLTAILPPLLFGAPLSTWVYRSLILLVVSCPCALAISTPVSMVSSITGAARNGVFVKSAEAIEAVAKLKIVAFDKTGTLTRARLAVTDIVPFDGVGEDEVLQVSASLESKSSHPIAHAIVEAASNNHVKLEGVGDFRSTPGKGVEGVIGNETYFLGSDKMFRDLGIPYPEQRIEGLRRSGKTVVLVGTLNPRGIIGAIAVADEIRPEAAQAVRRLKAERVEVVMISGDNEDTVAAIARNAGIDHFHAELLPEEKVEEVTFLTKANGNVAMVGDGINDAPALAQASVGIAMGAIGSDMALDTADVTLMHDDLSKVSYLVDLGRKTMRVVRENIAASILVKGTFAVLALPGLVSLWMAVAIGDMGLSLAVILNAMRLALFKSKT